MPPQKSCLYLHIGHHKTGSTYIQASLRKSARRLAEHGIDYVLPSDEQAASSDGTITSGFGHGLFGHDNAEILNLLTAGRLREGATYAFSSELAFDEIVDGTCFEDACAALREQAFDLRFLIFVRDPIGHAASNWQQGVKRDGLTLDVAEAFASFDVPERVMRCVERIEGAGGRVELRNYSRRRSELLSVVETWLMVPPGSLLRPDVEVINRSLTRAEITLQRKLNVRLGESGHLLADRLCEELSDLEPDRILPDVDVQRSLWDRLEPTIRQLNARMDPSDHYREDLEEPVDLDRPLVFSDAQLDVVATAFADLADRSWELLHERNQARNEVNKLSRYLTFVAPSVEDKVLVAALAKRLRRRAKDVFRGAGTTRRPRSPANGDGGH